MIPSPADAALVEYAIRDALANLVSADAHDMVIAVSLNRANSQALPEDPTELESFCDGPLADSLHQMFGAETASAVQAQLHHTLPRIFCGSGLQRSVDRSGMRTPGEAAWTKSPMMRFQQSVFDDPHDKDTVRSPDDYAENDDAPDTAPLQNVSYATVFLVSEDDQLPAKIKLMIGTPSPVVRVPSMLSLYDVMPESWGPPLVVVDARRKLDVLPLLDLAEQISQRGKVIVWGEDEQLRAQAPNLLRNQNWLAFDSGAQVADIAAMLSLFIGP